jgi:cytochrome c oxidase subunit 2
MTPEIALFPQAASTTAYEVDALFWFLLAVCGAVGLLVAFLLIFFSVRYRRRAGDYTPPPQTASAIWLEWTWTIAPVFIFAVMFFWGAVVYVRAYTAPEDASVVYVVAKQWMWKFQHSEGQREINTLHVPAGRPVKLLLTSEDVIHSFFVPDFRVHMDVLPARYTSVWFEATRPGSYHLFCSQFCGTAHANMRGTVVVLEPAEYQRWLSETAEGSLALEGRKIFLKYRCVSCHQKDAQARAPSLANLFGSRVVLNNGQTLTADEQYLHDSILHAGAQVVAGYQEIMPTFEGLISEEEVIQLIAYIQSLEGGELPTRVEDYPPPVRTEDLPQKDHPLPAGAEVPDL